MDAAGERCKLLMLTLARPDPTEEEATWKKGGQKGRWREGRRVRQAGSAALVGALQRSGQQVQVLRQCSSAVQQCCRHSPPCLDLSLVPPPPPAPLAGKRQDNRAAAHPGSMHQKGWRFFADDEDHYGLEDILQAGAAEHACGALRRTAAGAGTRGAPCASASRPRACAHMLALLATCPCCPWAGAVLLGGGAHLRPSQALGTARGEQVGGGCPPAAHRRAAARGEVQGAAGGGGGRGSCRRGVTTRAASSAQAAAPVPALYLLPAHLAVPNYSCERFHIGSMRAPACVSERSGS